MNKRQAKKRNKRDLFEICFDKKPTRQEKKHALEMYGVIKKALKKEDKYIYMLLK